jgi:23S rRNA (uracil1939-C5)-methyltransferase
VIHSDAIAHVVRALRTLTRAVPRSLEPLLAPFVAEAGGVLRAIDVREAQGPGSARASVLLTLVLDRGRAASKQALVAAARELAPSLPFVIGIAASFHDGKSPQVLGGLTVPLHGQSSARDSIGATWHEATFGAFVQAHRGQAAKIHALVARRIAELAGPRPRVLELYGGAGAISLALAHAGHAVTMVESFAPAADAARRAAYAQRLALDAFAGDASAQVESLVAAGERFDAVVVNPPRRGVAPRAREALARLEAKAIVYVSCDPDTLARDLDHFARLGYRATALHPFDMIPQTAEVETVVALERTALPSPLVLHEDEDILIVVKRAHETIRDAADASSLLARCGPRAAGFVPVLPMDAGTSGVCLFARSRSIADAWANAARTAGLVHLVGARGITSSSGSVSRPFSHHGRTQPARTRYRRIAVASGHSLLRVTGDGTRGDAIARHLAAIGHPVLGDERHGHAATNRHFDERAGLDRPFVHLGRITLTHPGTGAPLELLAPLSGDLCGVLVRIAEDDARAAVLNAGLGFGRAIE